jgi:5-methylthioadenosine/S-adenosylhomocysteine deaminase
MAPHQHDDSNRGIAQRVDLIMSGDVMVTIDDARPVIERGSFAVDEGRIVAVGTEAEIATVYTGETVLLGHGMALMPGLVNGHTHVAMVLFRGLADDLTLEDWLTHYIFPAEAHVVDAAFVRTGQLLGCWEMLRGGTTTFLDMYYQPDATANAVIAAGLRAVIAPAALDFPSPGGTGWHDDFAAVVDFVACWQGRHPRIVPCLAPHSAYTVSPDHLREAIAMARRLDVPITIHLAETKTEVEAIQERYGARPVRHLDNLGFLDPRLIASHVVWANDEEIALLAARRERHPQPDLQPQAGLRRGADPGDAECRGEARSRHGRRRLPQHPRPVAGHEGGCPRAQGDDARCDRRARGRAVSPRWS